MAPKKAPVVVGEQPLGLGGVPALGFERGEHAACTASLGRPGAWLPISRWRRQWPLVRRGSGLGRLRTAGGATCRRCRRLWAPPGVYTLTAPLKAPIELYHILIL